MKDEVFETLYEVGRNSMVVNSRAQQFHWVCCKTGSGEPSPDRARKTRQLLMHQLTIQFTDVLALALGAFSYASCELTGKHYMGIMSAITTATTVITTKANPNPEQLPRGSEYASAPQD